MASLSNYDAPITEVVINGPVRSVPVPVTATSINVLKTSTDLCGFSFYETTGSASAHLNLYDGLDNTGTFVAAITLSANESIRDWFGFFGVRIRVGLYADVVSGSVGGAVWVRL
jgi:hypothetical protein